MNERQPDPPVLLDDHVCAACGKLVQVRMAGPYKQCTVCHSFRVRHKDYPYHRQ